MGLTEEEKRSFLDDHIPHRLSVLLSFLYRHKWDPEVFKGRRDLQQASLEGSFVMARVFIEFLGVKSSQKSGLHLEARARHNDKGNKILRDSDVMLDSFELKLLRPEDFDDKRDLIARVHDGISKSTAHFTLDPGNTFVSEDDFIPAIECIYQKLKQDFFGKLGEEPKLCCDLLEAV